MTRANASRFCRILSVLLNVRDNAVWKRKAERTPSEKIKTSRFDHERFSRREELLTTGLQSVAFHDATLHNRNARGCDGRSLHWNIPSGRIRRYCTSHTSVHLNATFSRARSFLRDGSRTRGIRGAYPRRWRSCRYLENGIGLARSFTWDKSESSRILASMVIWLAWILATASAAANRNASSIVLRSSLGIGTRDNFTETTREWRSPRGRSRMIHAGRSITTDRSSRVHRAKSQRATDRVRGAAPERSQAGSSSRTDTVTSDRKNYYSRTK